MKIMTADVLADPPAGRIITACNQPARAVI
jgi:hypothetical protein